MALTLTEAAAATEASKSTILRAIKTGKISATRHELTGAWLIEPAELHRVYRPRDDAPTARQDARQGVPRNGHSATEISLLRELLAERDARLVDREATIDDLRRRLDDEGRERRAAQEKLTALLPAPRAWLWWRRP